MFIKEAAMKRCLIPGVVLLIGLLALFGLPACGSSTAGNGDGGDGSNSDGNSDGSSATLPNGFTYQESINPPIGWCVLQSPAVKGVCWASGCRSWHFEHTNVASDAAASVL